MVHKAGPYIAGLQRCQRCNEILADYRNAAWPEGQSAPTGWEENAHVEVITGNPKYSGLTNDAVDCQPLH